MRILAGLAVRAEEELVARFQAADCRVLIVSALGSPAVIRAGLAAGAQGYMSKRESPADLLAAVRAVADGEGFLTPEMAGILAEAPGQVPDLSIQELTALRLYASGMKLTIGLRRGPKPSERARGDAGQPMPALPTGRPLLDRVGSQGAGTGAGG